MTTANAVAPLAILVRREVNSTLELCPCIVGSVGWEPTVWCHQALSIPGKAALAGADPSLTSSGDAMEAERT